MLKRTRKIRKVKYGGYDWRTPSRSGKRKTPTPTNSLRRQVGKKLKKTHNSNSPSRSRSRGKRRR